jgi:macrodomain Ter protein organizer (MatP/YcbG family)
MLGFILMPIIVYIVKIVFFEKNATKKREITQIKCWIELSSLVNRLGSTLSTSVLSFKLLALIVIEKF